MEMVPQANESDVLTEALQNADIVRAEIYRILKGEYADDPKTMILVAWLDLALEHHQAIIQLIRSALYGSAFALVRCVFEIMFKAYWVVGCGNQEDVGKIARKDNFEFPETEEMTAAIDKAFNMGSYFTVVKKAGWRAMNSYTHSGLLQLARRFSGGKVALNYSAGEILEVVNSTTAAVVAIAHLLAESTQRKEDELDEITCLVPRCANGSGKEDV